MAFSSRVKGFGHEHMELDSCSRIETKVVGVNLTMLSCEHVDGFNRLCL